MEITGRFRQRAGMADSVNDNPQDPAQQSLAGILADLSALRAGKKAKALSRMQRRVIAPVETGQDNDDPRLAFQHTVFCQTSLPYRVLEGRRAVVAADPGHDAARSAGRPRS